jgi:MFS family permease
MNFKALKEEFALLWRFYVLFLLFGFMASMTGSVYILFYLNSGLSFTQLGIIFGVSMLVGVLAEIPTGAVADIFGRKFSVGLSFLLWSITLILIPLFPRFMPLLLIVSLAELFSTLRSGADDAWAVDYMKQNKKSALVHAYFMHVIVARGIGTMIGGIASIFIVTYFGIPATWIFQGLMGFVIAGFIFMVGKEKFRRKKANILAPFKNTFIQAKEGLVYSMAHPVLLMYLLGLFFVLFTNLIQVIWQPMLVQVGMTPASIGLLIAAMGLFGVVSPWFGQKYISLFKNGKVAIVLSNLFIVMMLPLFAFITAPWQGIVIFLLSITIVNLSMPFETKFIHSFIPSNKRATVGSIISMAAKLAMFLMFVSNGFVIDIIGMRGAALVYGLISLVGVFCLVLMKPEGQKTHI